MALPGRSPGGPRLRRHQRGGGRAGPEEQGRQQDLSLARNRQRGRGARVLFQSRQPHQQLVLRSVRLGRAVPHCACAQARHAAAGGRHPARGLSQGGRRGVREGRVSGRIGSARSRRSGDRMRDELSHQHRVSREPFRPDPRHRLALRARAIRPQLQPHSPGRLPAGSPRPQLISFTAGGRRNARNLQRAVLPGASSGARRQPVL